LDPAGLSGHPVVVASWSGPSVEAEVLWVDHFGNAELNVAAADAGPPGRRVQVRTGAREPAVATVAPSYASLADGALGLIPDSVGLLALCLDRRSAAEALGLGPGDRVGLRD
jgi:hypothetical protein